MPLQSHSRPQDTREFTLHDDSHRARVVLGTGFTFQSPAQGIEGIKNLLHHVSVAPPHWKYTDTLLTLEIISQTKDAARWIIGCEESPGETKAFRAVATNHATDSDCHLQIYDDFRVEGEPHDLMDILPDSVFGALLGAATGMTEVKKLLEETAQTPPNPHHEAPRSDWRAPRFSFTLQTASGSPFVERWAFAIQESAIRAQRFRVWIEQQRTGKEIQLLLREDGTIEGIHEVEALPAAIHGASLGLLMGIDYALHSLQRAAQTDNAGYAGLSDQEAEALLEQYVAQIRERRNAVPNN